MKTLTVGNRLLKMDDDVYEFLKDKKISFNSQGYPYIRLHTMFFPLIPDENVVDHINRDVGDFRRSNLRLASYGLNGRNKGKKIKAASRYKGLKVQRNGTWAAEISVNRRSVFLGRWRDEHEAARAYDIAQLFFFPDLGSFNFPVGNYHGLDLQQELHAIISRRPLNNNTGHRGVIRSRNGKRWYARYGNQHTGTYKHLGTFDSPEEAAHARDAYAKTTTCRNTRLNSPSWSAFIKRIGSGEDFPRF